MRRESIKKRLKQAEMKIGVNQIDSRNVARVYFYHDDLYDWYLPNGDIEKITEDEYVARGGLLIAWNDDYA